MSLLVLLVHAGLSGKTSPTLWVFRVIFAGLAHFKQPGGQSSTPPSHAVNQYSKQKSQKRF